MAEKHLEVSFGANRKKSSGSQMDQGPHGAGKTKRSESHRGGNTGNDRVKARKNDGGHLSPRVSTRTSPKHSSYGREGHGESGKNKRSPRFGATRVV